MSQKLWNQQSSVTQIHQLHVSILKHSIRIRQNLSMQSHHEKQSTFYEELQGSKPAKQF